MLSIGFLNGTGSNNWAVDGSMTESGLPLLAGDPHLAVTVPCFWHVQHITGPDFSFIGASMPGVPGVTYYGHNGHTAWSLTTAGVDAQDIYFEQIRNPEKPEYKETTLEDLERALKGKFVSCNVQYRDENTDALVCNVFVQKPPEGF